MFIVCVITSYLLVLGDLENPQCIIGGNIWKKDFNISGWLLISIHVREKTEMESWRVGGGGVCTKQWTYTPRYISWDIFQNNTFYVLSPLLPSQIVK